jgi:exonuclease III
MPLPRFRWRSAAILVHTASHRRPPSQRSWLRFAGFTTRAPAPLSELSGRYALHQREIRRVRIVAWNCRRASATSQLWNYFEDLSPDLALLQEVSAISAPVAARWRVAAAFPVGKAGRPQRFRTAILIRGELAERLPLEATQPWVHAELSRFAGNLLTYRVLPQGGTPLVATSVYSPAWPVDRGRLTGIDTTGVQLTQSRDVWVADLLCTALAGDPRRDSIVGGDFNLSETFDAWRGGPRGNREYLDRMAALSMTECLRHAAGALVPTFRNPRGGQVMHQMDHLFASPDLASRLDDCGVGSAERVFGEGLSDHLPIIADFN